VKSQENVEKLRADFEIEKRGIFTFVAAPSVSYFNLDNRGDESSLRKGLKHTMTAGPRFASAEQEIRQLIGSTESQKIQIAVSQIVISCT
jgi:hypothetical protein